ncbi:PilW family protein [uncultured Aquabacterium sp.]|uniref:PilW family protein n=1 Tax=Aquabacterium sp. TaxID=1872578 RepID=UPI00260057BE|nr:PilW family protein [uncultured Aquabacterium sp.]
MSAIKNRPARGLTLVELMVAMVIGLVVVLVATRLFVGSRATQRATDETAALFETGQMVLELLGREIANAGFYPVVSTEPTVGSGVPSTNVLVSYDAAVKGLNGGVVPDAYLYGLYGCADGKLNATLSGCVANGTGDPSGSDTLVVSYFTNDAFSLDVGQRGDCSRADVGADTLYNAGRVGEVTKTSASGPVKEARGTMGLPPTSPLLVANRFFLNALSYVDDQGKRINTFALACRGNGGGSTVDLVPGVVQMTVRYGVFSDDTLRPQTYLTATEVRALSALTLGDGAVYQPWQRVASVRLCVMVRSLSSTRFQDGGTGGANVVDCNGTSVTPPSGVVYRTFTQVFGVKNRQLRTVELPL